MPIKTRDIKAFNDRKTLEQKLGAVSLFILAIEVPAIILMHALN